MSKNAYLSAVAGIEGALALAWQQASRLAENAGDDSLENLQRELSTLHGQIEAVANNRTLAVIRMMIRNMK